jgi:glycosyltransferase involved in cell wall biosynthesis
VRLTVVTPIYNEVRKVEPTLRAVEAAVTQAPDVEADYVVVDDGSTDGSGAAAAEADVAFPVHVVSQPNRGKFAARLAGLHAATGEFILLLDAGAILQPDSLRFLAERVRADPPELVWNGHTLTYTQGKPLDQFWDVVTALAFADYVAAPRKTSYGIEEFDRYPKGTGCFFAPRVLLLEAFGKLTTYYEDPRYSSDDTAPLRWLAARERINIAPDFAFVYEYGERLPGFFRHSYHRGIHFLDGHGRRGSRFLPLVLVFYPLSLLLLVVAIRRPLSTIAVAGGTAAAAAGVAVSCGRHRRESLSFGAVLPLYALAHGLGMWHGLALAFAGRRRRT